GWGFLFAPGETESRRAERRPRNGCTRPGRRAGSSLIPFLGGLGFSAWERRARRAPSRGVRLMPVCRWGVVVLVFVLQAAHAPAAAPRGAALPDRFRDLKMYSPSRPDPKDPGRVVITTAVRNEGKKPLDVRAVLDPDEQAGFRGSEFQKRL